MKITIQKYLVDKIKSIILPKGLYKEPIYLFIYTLNNKYQANNTIFGSDTNHYINLHRDTLDKIFTHKKRTSYLNVLKDNNIITVLKNNNNIESYSNFVGNIYSKSYKIVFNDASIEDLKEYISVNIKNDKKQLSKNFSRPTKANLRLHYEQLKSKTLELNAEKCLNWINSNKNILSNDQINCFVSQINNFTNKHIHISKKYRMYSNITGIKKEFRSYITINGDSLVEIDLRTSQPYFLSYLMLMDDKNNIEYIKFHKIITNDDLYTYILEISGLNKYKYTRDDIKLQIMRLLFSASNGNLLFSNDEYSKHIINNMHFKKDIKYSNHDKQIIYNNQKKYNQHGSLWRTNNIVIDFKKIFKDIFPEVYTWIQNFKNVHNKNKRLNKPTIQLSELLTKYESDVFFKVTTDILKDNKLYTDNIPVLLCHDAIYTTTEHVTYILSELQIEFKKQGYINPQLIINNK